MSIMCNSIKCPECGATLSIEESREYTFCSYCGTKILLTNENEHIYRHIDEASIKQAETDRLIRMRELDIQERNSSFFQKAVMVWAIASSFLVLLGIVGFVIDSPIGLCTFLGIASFAVGFIYWKGNQDSKDGKIKIPSSVSDFESKNYIAIESALRSAGFVNITCIPLNDLTIGVLKKPGTVESITINGKQITFGRYFPNVPIVIAYHSLCNR